MNLKEKKILFICPRFFGYEKFILEKLQLMGASVIFLSDRAFDKPWQSALTKLFPSIATKLNSILYLKWLKNNNNKSFDLMFVINGQTLSKQFLYEFKELNPHAKLILYIWDSLKNKTTIQKKFKFFDRILSFDPNDSKKYKLIFRPLFFLNNQNNLNKKSLKKSSNYLVFIGTIHSDRYKVIKTIEKALPSNVKTFLYMHIQAPWVFWYYKIFNNMYRNAVKKEFNFLPIEQKLFENLYRNSCAVIDIEHPLQKGLTMRTLEALGAQKKIITTNSDIKNYDFYNPNNIKIISRTAKDYTINTSFFTTKYQEIDSSLYKKYSIDGWIKDIFSTDLMKDFCR